MLNTIMKRKVLPLDKYTLKVYQEIFNELIEELRTDQALESELAEEHVKFIKVVG